MDIFDKLVLVLSHPKNKEGYKNYLVLAIVLIVLGVFMLVNPELAEKLLGISLGLVVGFSGVMNLLVAFSIKKEKVPFWIWGHTFHLLERW